MLEKLTNIIPRIKFFLLLPIVFTGVMALAQEGTIKGRVTEKGTGEALPFATVTAETENQVIAGATTDMDGFYTIKQVPAGTYTVKGCFVGTQCMLVTGVKLEPDSTVILDLELKAEAPALQCIELRTYSTPLLNANGIKSGMTISRRDLKRLPSRSVSMRVANTVGTFHSTEESYIQHNTESYDEIKENIFKEVLNNPLSTFSVDVDKASYSNIRRFISHNKKPPKDAIRIEELVNYFDYDYPQPKNDDPFSINFETGECPWNPAHDLVLIGVQGKEIEKEQIPPSNLVFLIDVSGSMDAPNKLPLLMHSFKILVNNLRPVDRVAMVVYAGAAGLVLESTPGSNKNKIMNVVNNLYAGGSTAGGEGIRLAYKIAKQNFIPKGNNRIILATDGDFNIGTSSNAEMVRLVEEKRNEGVFLSVLGFGMGNYKDSKMEAISNAGNGNYAYIDNILEAQKVFGKELWGTLYTIAKDVKIQVEFNPTKVKAYRLIGYENRILNKEDFNDDKKDAGDIGSGHSVTALYEIIPADSDEEMSSVDPLIYQTTQVLKSKDLMSVKLRYKQPDEEASTKIVKTIPVKPEREANLSENFIFAASVAEFGMLLRDSEHKANASYDQALSLAKSAKGEDEEGYRQEFIRLIKKSRLMAQ